MYINKLFRSNEENSQDLILLQDPKTFIVSSEYCSRINNIINRLELKERESYTSSSITGLVIMEFCASDVDIGNTDDDYTSKFLLYHSEELIPFVYDNTLQITNDTININGSNDTWNLLMNKKQRYNLMFEFVTNNKLSLTKESINDNLREVLEVFPELFI